MQRVTQNVEFCSTNQQNRGQTLIKGNTTILQASQDILVAGLHSQGYLASPLKYWKI